MVSEQLLEYIKKEDGLGKSKEEVEGILLAADWHRDAVEEAFALYYKEGKKDKKTKKKKVEVKIDDSKAQAEKPKSIPVMDPLELESPHDMLLEAGDIDMKLEDASKAEPKEDVPSSAEERKVRPVFLYILFFVVGAGMMAAASFSLYNYYNKSAEQSSPVSTDFVQQEKTVDDKDRMDETLKMQESLEEYYTEYKSYPENLSVLSDVPQVSGELNYAYTPIGSPPQSYTLNMEMKSTSDGEFKVEGGFLTLKNKQGTK